MTIRLLMHMAAALHASGHDFPSRGYRPPRQPVSRPPAPPAPKPEPSPWAQNPRAKYALRKRVCPACKAARGWPCYVESDDEALEDHTPVPVHTARCADL